MWMFGTKIAIFVQKYAFLGTCRPSRLIWCPVGWLVGGCGARAVYHRLYHRLKASEHKVLIFCSLDFHL